MLSGYDWMSYLFNAFLAVIWIVFLLLVLKSKYGTIRTAVCFVSVQVISLFACSFFPTEWFMLRFVWGIIAVAACAFWLFQDKWTRILLCTVLIFVSMPVCEMLFLMIARITYGNISSATADQL